MILYLFSAGTLSLKEMIRPLCLKKCGVSDLLFFLVLYCYFYNTVHFGN